MYSADSVQIQQKNTPGARIRKRTASELFGIGFAAGVGCQGFRAVGPIGLSLHVLPAKFGQATHVKPLVE